MGPGGEDGRRFDRRAFLRAGSRAGVAAAGGAALAACGPEASSLPPIAPPASGSPTASPGAPGPPSPAGPPSAAAWRALAASLDGRLVRPGDRGYGAASQLYDPRFDVIHPLAIAECATASDVARSVAFAGEHGLPIAARSGGHSYAGYSTCRGLVVDVAPMRAAAVDRSAGTATIGAGTRLIDLYATLASAGVLVPGGTCPTVGIAGLALGGGIGVVGRRYGLTCDNVASLTIVTADGRVRACDASNDPDLFWACRGGGGGNFGIVTSFTFSTHTAPASLALATIDWPWAAAVDVVAAWMDWAPGAPDELWSNCLLLGPAADGDPPAVRVNGVLVGGAAELGSLVDSLVAHVGVAATSRFVGASGYLDAMLIEAGCEGRSIAECHLPSQDPRGMLARESFAAKSDLLSGPLAPAGIATLVAGLQERAARGLAGGGVGIDAWGGAIGRVAADATAFVHRDATASIQYSTDWPNGAGPSLVREDVAWLRSLWGAMRPYVNGFAYQNYIDPDLPDWLHAYYGANLPRLRRVKAAYDPTDLFRFAQSIPPA